MDLQLGIIVGSMQDQTQARLLSFAVYASLCRLAPVTNANCQRYEMYPCLAVLHFEKVSVMVEHALKRAPAVQACRWMIHRPLL